MEPITTSVFLGAVFLPALMSKFVDVAGEAIRAEWKKLVAVEQCIAAFCKDLPTDSATTARIDKKLSEWCQSNEFPRIIRSNAKNHTDLTVEEFVQSFIDAGGADACPDGLKPEKLIPEFLNELAIHLELADPESKAYIERQRYLTLHADINSVRVEVSTMREEFTERLDATVNTNEKILRLVEGLVKNRAPEYTQEPEEVPDTDSRAVAELDLHSDIDTAVQHLQRGKPRTAEEILLATRRKALDLPTQTDYLRTRLFVNLGVCYLKLERYLDAEIEYKHALQLRKSRLNYSNLAQALLLCGEREKALEYSNTAMGFKERTATAVAIHLQILFANGKLKEIEQLEISEPLLTTTADGLLALGQNALDAGRYSDAEKYFAQGQTKSPYDPQFLMLQVQSLVEPLKKNMRVGTPLDGIPDLATTETLKRIEGLISEALGMMREEDHDYNRNRALLNRCSVKLMLGNKAGAEDDCNTVLLTDPNNQIALGQAGMLQSIEHKNYADALELFAKLDESHSRRISIMIANCYFELGKFDEARAQMAIFEETALRDNMMYPFAHESLRFAERAGTTDSTVAELLAKYSHNGDVLFAVSEVYRVRREWRTALAFLVKAEKSEACSIRANIPRTRAQIYFDAGLYWHAAAVYRKFIDMKTNSGDLYEYIASLSNAHNSTSGIILSLAREARRRERRVIAIITEIEIMQLIGFGDYDAAHELAKELAKDFPSNRVERILFYAGQFIRR